MEEYLNYISAEKKIDLIIRTPNGPIRFFSTFKNQDNNKITITKPTSKNLAFSCVANQPVEIYAYTNGGVFKLKCKFISCSQSECLLTLPSSVEKMQRREYIRVDLKIKTVLDLIIGDSKKTIQATSRNISAKGINLLLEEDISVYSKIELKLLFEEENITTIAKKVKVKPVKVDNKIYYDTSLSFITINEKGINFIVKKCFEYEAAQRRKLLDSQI